MNESLEMILLSLYFCFLQEQRLRYLQQGGRSNQGQSQVRSTPLLVFFESIQHKDTLFKVKLHALLTHNSVSDHGSNIFIKLIQFKIQ